MKPFKIVQKDLGDRGKVRFSHGEGDARIEAKTTGIALKYVLKGMEHYEIENKQLDLCSGRFIILPEGIPFRALSREQNTTGICLDLSSSEFAKAFPCFESMDLLFGIPFQTLNHIELGTRIRQMRGVLDRDPENDPVENVYDALVEFCLLVSGMQEGLEKAYAKNHSRQQVLLKLLMARDFIYSNFTGQLRLDTLAAAVGISKSHLHRLFTSCFEISPKKLQQQLRMKRALELIQLDKYTMKEIAFELGYSDLAAFSNQFKAWHLVSPKHHRALIA